MRRECYLSLPPVGFGATADERADRLAAANARNMLIAVAGAQVALLAAGPNSIGGGKPPRGATDE